MSNIRKKIGGFLMIAFYCGGIFAWSVVHAQDTPEAGVQISPIRFDWQMQGGETRTDEIVVHNFSDIAHNVDVSVENFYVSDDSRQANFYVPDDEHPLKAYDVINWITAPEDFTIQPGETKKFNFSVSVPEGQPTNGYYGSVFFRTSTEDAQVNDDEGNGLRLGVNYRVGALVTIAVQGDDDMRINGNVEEFNVIQKVFWDDPIQFYARLKSDGNIHYQAAGKIDVFKFGKKFATTEINSEVMYPGKMRTFIENVRFKPWDFGVYSATLHMQSEDGTVVFEGDIPTFFVIPWKMTVAIIGMIALVVIMIKVFKKKFKIVSRSNEKR